MTSTAPGIVEVTWGSGNRLFVDPAVLQMQSTHMNRTSEGVDDLIPEVQIAHDQISVLPFESAGLAATQASVMNHLALAIADLAAISDRCTLEEGRIDRYAVAMSQAEASLWGMLPPFVAAAIDVGFDADLSESTITDYTVIEAEVGAILEVGGGVALQTKELPDGRWQVTPIVKADLGVGVEVGALVEMDGKEIAGADAEVSGGFGASIGNTYEFDSKEELDRFLEEYAKAAIAEAAASSTAMIPGVGWGLKLGGKAIASPPKDKPVARTVTLSMNESASLLAHVGIAGGAGLEGEVKGTKTTDLKTKNVTLTAQVTLETQGTAGRVFTPPGTSGAMKGSQAESVTYAISVVNDRHGNPLEVSITTQRDVTGTMTGQLKSGKKGSKVKSANASASGSTVEATTTVLDFRNNPALAKAFQTQAAIGAYKDGTSAFMGIDYILQNGTTSVTRNHTQTKGLGAKFKVGGGVAASGSNSQTVQVDTPKRIDPWD